MAIDNLPSSDESRLSGAYIRSLVKQLTSSKPLDANKTLSNNVISCGVVDESIPKGDKLGMAKQNNQLHGGQQGHKKQVRRRLHTSRPYQERLLNMAEARKEIVTALKFHRAAMKQANEKKQQQLAPDQHPQDCGMRKSKNESFPLFSTNQYYSSYNNNSSSNNNNSCFIPSSSLVESPTIYESLNIPLPNQPLGLNLNLQAFTNLDTTFNYTPSNYLKHSISSPSMSSPSSSSSSSTPRDPMAIEGGVGPTSGMNNMVVDHMHPSLDEEEMEEIRSIGEKHQIEWDDTLNLVKSAWWFKFLKTTEFSKEMKGVEDNDDDYYKEFMEFPAWLSANDSFLQQHFDDYCSQDYRQDTTLPWMDIGDIDGMDDEWLS